MAANVAKLTSNDFRRGNIRELARIKKSEEGIATPSAAKAAGHSQSSLEYGTTDMYNGSALVSTYKERIQFSTTTHDPKFTELGIRLASTSLLVQQPQKPTEEEITAEVEAKQGDPKNAHDRKNAKARLVDRRKKLQRKQAMNEAQLNGDTIPVRRGE